MRAVWFSAIVQSGPAGTLIRGTWSSNIVSLPLVGQSDRLMSFGDRCQTREAN